MGLRPRGLAVLLAAAALAAAAGACAAGPRTVEVDIRHSRFLPADLRAAPGETVRFVVRNLDPIPHEFILGDEEIQRLHEEGTEHAHDAGGEISIPAGETRETVYTFGEDGTLLLGCHLPGHYAFGMRGEVRVG